MDIKFQGEYGVEEAADSLASILTLLKEHYGIEDFSEMKLQLCLLNGEGEEVELVDTATSEVLGVLDVQKPKPKGADKPKSKKHLKLVVDNTKK